MRARLLLHLDDGVTIAVRVAGVMRDKPWTARFPTAALLLGARALVGVDAALEWRGRVVALRATAWRLSPDELTLELEEYPTDGEVRRGSPEVERVFERLGLLCKRVTYNDWSDRATGRFAPKRRPEDAEPFYG